MQTLLELLKTFLDAIVPPDTTVEDFTDMTTEEGRDRVRRVIKVTRAWRWNVAGTLLLLVAATLYIYLTFARADEVDKKIQGAVEPLKKDVTSIKGQVEELAKLTRARQIEDLRQKIFEMRIAQCKARASETQNPYTERLAELADLYTDLTARTYQLPACEDL